MVSDATCIFRNYSLLDLLDYAKFRSRTDWNVSLEMHVFDLKSILLRFWCCVSSVIKIHPPDPNDHCKLAVDLWIRMRNEWMRKIRTWSLPIREIFTNCLPFVRWWLNLLLVCIALSQTLSILVFWHSWL